MRLDKVFIDGFKNIKDLTVDFDENHLTTVLIGQNGAGKSNLIEAITQVFRWVDTRRSEPRFRYRIHYRIQPQKKTVQNPPRITLSNMPGEPAICVNDKEVKRTKFDSNKLDWFPDLIFGYYSGDSRRLESLFDSHQRRYYDDIKLEDDERAIAEASAARRLFYCRPIHGVLALVSLFSFPETKVTNELSDRLGITGFHSLLTLFREPWFAKGKRAKAENLWGAGGLAGRAARHINELAFHPFALYGNAVDDYRDKKQAEPQYAAFLPSLDRLKELAEKFKSDQEMFYALEAMDISDLVREIQVWVTRKNDITGDVGFADLSDGERQLLMVLGLIRVSRGRRALFLLDEPDTHLNPHWQYRYLNLIEEWTGIASEKTHCHIILTSHNPLTISALSRDEVRVLAENSAGALVASPPYADPRGMGFTATLTEVFGLSSSLDIETQRLVDERNQLLQISNRSNKQQDRVIVLNDLLSRRGFLHEDREPLYQDFLRSWHDVRYADRPPLTPDEIAARRNAMKDLIKKLITVESQS